MPSGIPKNGGPKNCELPKCVEAKVKAHKGKKAPTNNIDAIIDTLTPLLEENVKFVSEKTLSDTFDIETDNVDMANITVALMNLDRTTLIKRLEEDNYSSAMTMIIYRINPYLPKSMRYTTYRSVSTINCREDLKDKIRDFIFAIIGYCMKIEDNFSQKYVLNPRAYNMLEVLKRRYKENWSENNGRSISVSHTDEVTDNKIEIVIKDA